MRLRIPFTGLVLSLAVGLNVAGGSLSAQEPGRGEAGEIVMREVLVLPAVGRAGRSAIHTDAVEAKLVAGDWRRPAAGDTVRLPDGSTESWEPAAVDTNGVVRGRGARGGYVDWAVASPTRRVMLLQAAEHNLVYVNGELRMGDPYSAGYVELPVLLEAGTNELLFQGSRGRLRAKLVEASAPVIIAAGDTTLPDLVQGENEPVWCGVVLLNATTNFQEMTVRAMTSGSPARRVDIPPLGTRKAPFLLRPAVVQDTNDYAFTVEVTLDPRARKERFRTELKLRVRRPDQTCKRTFLSAIEDSAQYYAVNPSSGPAGQALFLSLHGASVEAIGQADAYSPKRWGPIVCPTNRRPYGFDWEEWGRWDALEVLALAEDRYRPDPSRIYLTGHSMGGHGTWQLGALCPDRFAAIGPSAGWISFTSYVSTNAPRATNAVSEMLRRAAAASDTLLMATNYLEEGVYILHGSGDDNVPVTEARHMRELLAGFHRDFSYHEQPGVGHWWDVSDEPGADCVDWPPMFDMFAHHAIPPDTGLRRVRFVTVNPAVSARCHWVTVLAQQRSLLASAVDVQCDPCKRRVVGATTNVARLRLELPSMSPSGALTVQLDGDNLEDITLPEQPGSGSTLGLLLSRPGEHWQVAGAIPAADKNPGRSGPFREAFRNHFRFVYATRGTAQENAWALAKARYDADAFWYRGNGSVSLVKDVDYVRELSAGSRRSRNETGLEPAARNVILYGNADCNAAWPVLLGSSPVQVRRGGVTIGTREVPGDDLACLFLRPRPRNDTALVGVVSGTGLPGLRLTERMPYFLSGAGFPDCLLASAEMLSQGAAGVRAAGFFGIDWSVENGEFVWQSGGGLRSEAKRQ